MYLEIGHESTLSDVITNPPSKYWDFKRRQKVENGQHYIGPDDELCYSQAVKSRRA
jgi:hypothetical protein